MQRISQSLSGEITALMHWMIEYEVFRTLSACMYVIFAAGLFWLGAQHHAAKVNRDKNIGQYPPGYFTMLAIQLLPLMVTGFVLSDTYIIGTRLGTLAVVLVVYGMTTSHDGTFATWKYRLWTLFWIGVAMLGPILWSESEVVRTFVHDWQNWIAWLSVAVMILFVFVGQRAVARDLFRHFLEGNYTVKRLSLQFVRFFGFLFQAIHYGLSPSGATPIFGIDPIFLQGLIGTLGVTMVLVGALFGFLSGKSARNKRRFKERLYG